MERIVKNLLILVTCVLSLSLMMVIAHFWNDETITNLGLYYANNTQTIGAVPIGDVIEIAFGFFAIFTFMAAWITFTHLWLLLSRFSFFSFMTCSLGGLALLLISAFFVQASIISYLKITYLIPLGLS